MNILSLDWDYFIDATDTERFMMFPDGGNENRNNKLAEFLWTSRYSDYIAQKTFNSKVKLLTDFNAEEKLMDDVVVFVKKWRKPDTAITVALRHMDIDKHMTGIASPVSVINVDFHHDCYIHSRSRDYNSSNWAAIFLAGNVIDNYCWVRKEDSDDVFSIIKGEGEPPILDGKNITVSTDILKVEFVDGKGIDKIFLCLSPPWSPPHLDSHFKSFISQLYDAIEMKDKLVWSSDPNRWTPRIIADIEKRSKKTIETVEQFLVSHLPATKPRALW